MEDNTQYLKELAEAEKRKKQTELDQARAEATLQYENEQNIAKPKYTEQRQQANVQSQVGAKNLAEFWARRGQTNQGISAQAELSRGNALAGTIGGINRNENEYMSQLQNQYNTANRDINNQLTNAYSNIDTNLQTNLYNEKIRQQQIAEQKQKEAIAYQQWQDELNYKKQQDVINNNQEWARINASNQNDTIKDLEKKLQQSVYSNRILPSFVNDVKITTSVTKMIPNLNKTGQKWFYDNIIQPQQRGTNINLYDFGLRLEAAAANGLITDKEEKAIIKAYGLD